MITGAATGIGRACALRFSREGASVVIGDINDDGAAAVVSEIIAAGGAATSCHCDVTQSADLAALIGHAQEHHPSIDTVIANAGILDPAPLEMVSDEQFDTTYRANLRHPFVLVREAAPALRASKGTVVLTSSTGGLRGVVGQAGYSSTKAAVISLTRVLAAELGPAVRVNCVCPGWVDTPFNDPIWQLLGGRDREREVVGSLPLQRQADPDEVAGPVAFLASDDASYITGHALVVDGGLIAT